MRCSKNRGSRENLLLPVCLLAAAGEDNGAAGCHPEKISFPVLGGKLAGAGFMSARLGLWPFLSEQFAEQRE